MTNIEVQVGTDWRHFLKTYLITKATALLEPLSSLSTGKKKPATRLNRNSKLIKTIIKAIREKKGANIVSLDLRKIHEAVADYFIICEAGNPQQVRAIGEFVEEQAKKSCNEVPYRHEGYQGLQWVLLDYINVVVHIMQPDPRKFYQLEEMWSDAIREEYED